MADYNDVEECRALGHSWHWVPSDWTPLFGVPFTARCERCDVERRDTVNRLGDLAGRRYVRPKTTPKTERHTRAEWRLALLTRKEPSFAQVLGHQLAVESGGREGTQDDPRHQGGAEEAGGRFLGVRGPTAGPQPGTE